MSGGCLGFLPSTVVYRPSPVFPHILTPAPHSLQAAHQAPPGSKWRLLIMNLQLPSQKLTWHQNPIPIGSMYGIFTYMNSETWPHSTEHVGKYTIPGSYGIGKSSSQPFWEVLPTVGEFWGNDLGSCCLQKCSHSSSHSMKYWSNDRCLFVDNQWFYMKTLYQQKVELVTSPTYDPKLRLFCF